MEESQECFTWNKGGKPGMFYEEQLKRSQECSTWNNEKKTRIVHVEQWKRASNVPRGT